MKRRGSRLTADYQHARFRWADKRPEKARPGRQGNAGVGHECGLEDLRRSVDDDVLASDEELFDSPLMAIVAAREHVRRNRVRFPARTGVVGCAFAVVFWC